MVSKTVKAASIFSLVLLSGSALAQSGNISSGNSGNLGSAALGIDFFASNTPGANTKRAGGLANAIEAAFGGTQQRPESGERE